MGSIKGLFPVLVLFLLVSSLFAQNAKPAGAALPAEISRLEKLTLAAASTPAASKERYSAFLDLVRLYRLSGNSTEALKSCEAALAAFPADGRFLLEQGRLLVSQGEYEKAAAVTGILLKLEEPRDLVIQGRLLDAQLNAFRSGNTQALAALAEDPGFAGYRSGIYYTLWKLTGLSSYQTRLAAEFPGSPEAKIAASAGSSIPAGVDSAPTPLWLLYPGRESIVIAAPGTSPAVPTPAPQSPAAQSPAPQTPTVQKPTVQPQTAQTPTAQTPTAQVPTVQVPTVQKPTIQAAAGFLQTGLFSSEENAKAFTEQLGKAGFESRIFPRQLNGKDSWAVCVPYVNDMNAAIKKLKDAGFESFPVR